MQLKQLATAAVILAASLGASSAANAATFFWSFTSVGVNGSGAYSETGGLVTAISGSIVSGLGTDVITGLIPGGPAAFVSPSGAFIVNNVDLPFMDGWGWLFSGTLPGEWNVWSNVGPGPGPLSATLYHWSPGVGYDVTQSEGIFAVAVPEPAGWALMLAGFGGLGAVLRRRRAQAALAA